MHTLELSDQETQDIINALAAVTPSGGGGRLHSLLLTLTERTGLEPDDIATVRMQITAEKELDQGRAGA